MIASSCVTIPAARVDNFSGKITFRNLPPQKKKNPEKLVIIILITETEQIIMERYTVKEFLDISFLKRVIRDGG